MVVSLREMVHHSPRPLNCTISEHDARSFAGEDSAGSNSLSVQFDPAPANSLHDLERSLIQNGDGLETRETIDFVIEERRTEFWLSMPNRTGSWPFAFAATAVSIESGCVLSSFFDAVNTYDGHDRVSSGKREDRISDAASQFG